MRAAKKWTSLAANACEAVQAAFQNAQLRTEVSGILILVLAPDDMFGTYDMIIALDGRVA